MTYSIAAASPCFWKVTTFFITMLSGISKTIFFKAKPHYISLVFNTCPFTLSNGFWSSLQRHLLKAGFPSTNQMLTIPCNEQHIFFTKKMWMSKMADHVSTEERGHFWRIFHHKHQRTVKSPKGIRSRSNFLTVLTPSSKLVTSRGKWQLYSNRKPCKALHLLLEMLSMSLSSNSNIPHPVLFSSAPSHVLLQIMP